jgi:hypothetical protein
MHLILASNRVECCPERFQMQVATITEWKRSRRENEVMPTIPAHLGYVRKLPDKGVKLRAIKIAKAKADKGRNL